MDSPHRTSDDSPQLSAPLRFVPPSLLRVRRFLFEQGMSIVPWAPAGEVLDQFYDLLVSRHADHQFWQSVRELLEALQSDLRQRLEGDAQNNEVLSNAAHGALLDEIRERLSAGEASPGSFLALARRLSRPSLSVWLLLGSAATVSCDSAVENGNAGSTGGASSSSGGSSSGGTNSANTGGQTAVSLQGNAPCQATLDGGTVSSIESIAIQCTVAGAAQNDILACIATLNQSWRDGIQALLNCTTCDEATQYLNALVDTCSNLPPQFDSCLNHCIAIYNGVRMD